MVDVLSPQQVMDACSSVSLQAFIQQAQQQAKDILSGNDARLLVIVGPCSIHDIDAALEYAAHLKNAIDQYHQQLHMVMRVYFEKPRTTTGWKGLINDPYLDSSYAVNDGLKQARQLLHDINALGVPAATEFLDVFTPHYISDFITWGAIGARTTESRTHRELASSLSFPIGFKNNRDGNVQVAIDAVEAARHAHHFFTIGSDGKAIFSETQGNPHAHIVLRGGTTSTNYDASSIQKSVALLKRQQLLPYLMVDCSHGNSDKSHVKQIDVAQTLAKEIAAGNSSIVGVMLESFLHEGRQSPQPKTLLKYGQSITDACLSWEQTLPLLDVLAESIEQRKKLFSTKNDELERL